jgi:hypothetical protein
MRAFDEIQEDARQGQPFSSGFEWDHWSSAWCETCLHIDSCPLLMLVFTQESTPKEWRDDVPGGLADRYVCTEYSADPDDGDDGPDNGGGDDPTPDLPPDPVSTVSWDSLLCDPVGTS